MFFNDFDNPALIPKVYKQQKINVVLFQLTKVAILIHISTVNVEPAIS